MTERYILYNIQSKIVLFRFLPSTVFWNRVYQATNKGVPKNVNNHPLAWNARTLNYLYTAPFTGYDRVLFVNGSWSNKRLRPCALTRVTQLSRYTHMVDVSVAFLFSGFWFFNITDNFFKIIFFSLFMRFCPINSERFRMIDGTATYTNILCAVLLLFSLFVVGNTDTNLLRSVAG